MKIGNWQAGAVLLGILSLAYSMMWVGGVASYVFFGRPPLDAPWAASVFLLLAGLLVMVGSDVGDWSTLLIAAAIGFASEIIGIHTGALYGQYFYTEVLQPQIFDAPLVMTCAWMSLVSYIREMLRRLAWSGWTTRWPSRLIQAMLGAVWMTGIDLIIDPLAAHQLGYWRWLETGAYYGIPAKNFVGWFLVSGLIFFCLPQRLKSRSSVSEWVGLSIVLFFTIIALAIGLSIPGLIGVGLCVFHGGLVWKGAASPAPVVKMER